MFSKPLLPTYAGCASRPSYPVRRWRSAAVCPPPTIKKFELTGQISLRQLLLLWQSLDDLARLYALTQPDTLPAQRPSSIEEVLKDGL